MVFPDNPKPSDDEMVNSFVKTLTRVLGSEEEAKNKIYSVSTSTYTGFGALIAEELSYKVKELPGVLWVLPDSCLDVPNKDYGGDLFVDGKVIPRPQYRYSERQTNNRNRPRPRHDRRGKQCRLKGESIFKDRTGAKVREDLCISQLQCITKTLLQVDRTNQCLIGTSVE